MTLRKWFGLRGRTPNLTGRGEGMGNSKPRISLLVKGAENGAQAGENGGPGEGGESVS